MARRRTKGCC
jgi:hypothetical protein